MLHVGLIFFVSLGVPRGPVQPMGLETIGASQGSVAAKKGRVSGQYREGSWLKKPERESQTRSVRSSFERYRDAQIASQIRELATLDRLIQVAKESGMNRLSTRADRVRRELANRYRIRMIRFRDAVRMQCLGFTPAVAGWPSGGEDSNARTNSPPVHYDDAFEQAKREINPKNANERLKALERKMNERES